MNRATLRSVFLACLLLLSACQSSQSVIFSTQCIAPCWRNIEPGETHFQDAVNKIKIFSDYDSKGAAITHSWGIYSDVMDFGLVGGEDISVLAIDNIVALINFHNPQSVPLETCINASGSSVDVIQTTYSGGDAIQRWFFAVNPSTGISCGLQIVGNPTIEANTNIDIINFFDPGDYQRLYNAQQLVIANSDSYPVPGQFYKWIGYGNIDQLYPSR